MDDQTSHKKFSEKYNLPFQLLCDTDAKVSKKYGVYGKKNMFGMQYFGIYRTDESGKEWLERLNELGYAQRHDWRLPTMEEAMALLEPVASEHSGSLGIDLEDRYQATENYSSFHASAFLKSTLLYINPVFGAEKTLLTSDTLPGSTVNWRVYLAQGRCGYEDRNSEFGEGNNLMNGCSIRPVCSPEPEYLEWLASGGLDRQYESERLPIISDRVTELLRKSDELTEQGIIIDSTTFKTSRLAHIEGQVVRERVTHPLDFTVEFYLSVLNKDPSSVVDSLSVYLKIFVSSEDKRLS